MWHSYPDHYMNKLEEIIDTSDDSYVDYFLEVDLRYPDNIIEKAMKYQFCPESKIIPKDKNNDYMNKKNLKTYTKAKKVVCDWTDKKI